MLRGIGLTEERTVIFPSWIPDSNRFINENACKCGQGTGNLSEVLMNCG
jgi:hypothetical protein